MIKTLSRNLVIISALLMPLGAFGAEVVKVRHADTIYFDARGGGMKQPDGIGCSGKLPLIVADTGNGRLLKYTYEGGKVAGGDEIKVDQITYPVRVQLTSQGDILVLDGKQRRIVRLSPEGTFKGYVDPAGVSPAVVPMSFAIDNADNLYLLDVFSGRVVVLDQTGKFLRQIDFPEKYGFMSDIAVDMKGMVFLLDSVNAMVFSAAKDAKGFSAVTGNLKEYMNFPISLAVDNRGVMYLSDQNGSGVVVVGADGSFQGRAVIFGWKDGLVRYPSQICVNDKDKLFVADRDNSRVQIFSLIR